MKIFDSKWWTLNVPDSASITLCRDYASVKLSDKPDVEMRLTVLRGENADTTTADLEFYASSFYDGMRGRVSVDRNGWIGFVFTHVDTKTGRVSSRGYFGKKRYLAIASIDNSMELLPINLIEELMGQLEVKAE
jgi:hypothetical protein